MAGIIRFPSPSPPVSEPPLATSALRIEFPESLPVPRPRRGRPPRRVEITGADEVVHADSEHAVTSVEPEVSVAEPITASYHDAVSSAPVAESVSHEPQLPPEPETTEPVVVGAENKPRRGGWWARKS